MSTDYLPTEEEVLKFFENKGGYFDAYSITEILVHGKPNRNRTTPSDAEWQHVKSVLHDLKSAGYLLVENEGKDLYTEKFSSTPDRVKKYFQKDKQVDLAPKEHLPGISAGHSIYAGGDIIVGGQKITETKIENNQTITTNPKIKEWGIRIALFSLSVSIISIPWWTSWWSFLTNSSVPASENAPITDVVDRESKTNYFNAVKLRELLPLETGKKISELPDNSFFYSDPAAIVYEIQDESRDFIQAEGVKNSYFFELQKVNQRYYLVGYVSGEFLSEISSIGELKTAYGQLFPNKWGNVVHKIAVPFDAIYNIRDRQINIDEATKVTIFNIGFREAHELELSM